MSKLQLILQRELLDDEGGAKWGEASRESKMGGKWTEHNLIGHRANLNTQPTTDATICKSKTSTRFSHTTNCIVTVTNNTANQIPITTAQH